MSADADIRRTIEECGRQCEIALALERLFAMKGDFLSAAMAADLAQSYSDRAFRAVKA